MVELQSHATELKQAGIRVVAISYDTVDELKKFADQAKIEFPLLSDEQSKTIDAYGVRNESAKAGSRQDGIPHPGTFVIDSDGVIRAKLFVSVRKRHDSATLIDTVKKLRQAQPQQSRQPSGQ